MTFYRIKTSIIFDRGFFMMCFLHKLRKTFHESAQSCIKSHEKFSELKSNLLLKVDSKDLQDELSAIESAEKEMHEVVCKILEKTNGDKKEIDIIDLYCLIDGKDDPAVEFDLDTPSNYQVLYYLVRNESELNKSLGNAPAKQAENDQDSTMEEGEDADLGLKGVTKLTFK